MLEIARRNLPSGSSVTLLRANARGPLPFEDQGFDVVFVRLAPLGPSGVPRIQAAFQLLKPGGWYFEAGWRKERYDTPPTEWATAHGFATAEYHVWRYRRLQSEEEYLAALIDFPRMPYEDVDRSKAAAHVRAMKERQGVAGGIPVMVDEEVLVAQRA
jgi:SAM-dependent methyltransferase